MTKKPTKPVTLCIDGVKVKINGSKNACKVLRALGVSFKNDELAAKEGEIQCTIFSKNGKRHASIPFENPCYKPQEDEFAKKKAQVDAIIAEAIQKIEALGLHAKFTSIETPARFFNRHPLSTPKSTCPSI